MYTKIGNDIEVVVPSWSAPENIKAFSTTRRGGVSHGRYNSLNLGEHVADNPVDVECNRSRLMLPEQPTWLRQVHGNELVELQYNNQPSVTADGCFTTKAKIICAVLTADCLPVLVTNRQGTFVSAVHAGWRGLQQGIIANAIACYPGDPEELLLWIGPCIGPSAFEVGDDVRQSFKRFENAFQSLGQSGKFLADLPLIAKNQAQDLGVGEVVISGFCTFSEPESFFSYRRDGETGRMATLIWINES